MKYSLRTPEAAKHASVGRVEVLVVISGPCLTHRREELPSNVLTVLRPVAVLFSGGDAPGMNPLLRAIVRLGRNRHEADVLGVKDGYAGLVRTARRLESGQTTLASLMGEIDTHGGLLGVGRA